MEIWFDGSCVIDVSDIIEKYGKNSVVFQGPHATLRWPGTEAGMLFYPVWNTLNSEDFKTGVSTQVHDDPNGDIWAPLETNTTLYDHYWFWAPEKMEKRKSLDQIMECYYKSVGYGSVFLLNSTPDTTGLIDADRELKRLLDRMLHPDEERRRLLEQRAALRHRFDREQRRGMGIIEYTANNSALMRRLELEIGRAQAELDAARILFGRHFPILLDGGYRPGMYSSAPLEQLGTLTAEPLLEILENISDVREEVDDDDLKVWMVERAIQVAMMDLGILRNPVYVDAVEARIRYIERDRAFRKKLLVALSIVTTIAAGIIGGPWAAAGVGAAWSSGFLVESTGNYLRESAAENVALDPELRDISMGEPELAPIIWDSIGLGLDLLAIGWLVRGARAARATGSTLEFEETARRLAPDAADDLVDTLRSSLHNLDEVSDVAAGSSRALTDTGVYGRAAARSLPEAEALANTLDLPTLARATDVEVAALRRLDAEAWERIRAYAATHRQPDQVKGIIQEEVAVFTREFQELEASVLQRAAAEGFDPDSIQVVRGVSGQSPTATGAGSRGELGDVMVVGIRDDQLRIFAVVESKSPSNVRDLANRGGDFTGQPAWDFERIAENPTFIPVAGQGGAVELRRFAPDQVTVSRYTTEWLGVVPTGEALSARKLAHVQAGLPGFQVAEAPVRTEALRELAERVLANVPDAR
jgi:hypothetical protein